MVKKGGEQSDSKTTKIRFISVLKGNFSKRLKLPPKFVQHISWESTGLVSILGPTGGYWHVNLRRGLGDDAFLEGGWDKFVEDHSLEEYDYLIFKYEGKMTFTVRFFGEDLCEKETAFGAKVCEKGTGKRVESDKFSPDFQDVFQKSSYTKHRANSKSKHCGTSYGAAGMMEEPDLAPQGPESHCPSRSMFIREKQFELSRRSKIYPVKNPCFKRTIRKYNVSQNGYLFIARSFAKLYLPTMTLPITLRGPDGRRWTVTSNYKEDGCRLLSGWTTFVRVYKVNEGDTCIFELIGKEKLQVHVIRAKE